MDNQTEINTEGGAVVGEGGAVNIDQGNFIGRDQHDNSTHEASIEAHTEVGNDVTDSVIVHGRGNTVDQSKHNDGVINIVVNPAEPAKPPPAESRKRLMPEVEMEIRSNIKDLNTALNNLSTVVIELKGTVTTNNLLTQQTITLLSQQVEAAQQIAQRAEAEVGKLYGVNLVYQKQVSDWKINAALGLLVVIAAAVVYWIYHSAQGGRG